MWNILKQRCVRKVQRPIRPPSQHRDLLLREVSNESLAGVSADVRVSEEDPVDVGAVAANEAC